MIINKTYFILLVLLSFFSMANTNSIYQEKIKIIQELKAEKLIDDQYYQIVMDRIELDKPRYKVKTLGGTAEINGHVQNTSAVALNGYDITLLEVNGNNQDYVATATTDVSGNYSFTGLNAGTYLVYENKYDDDYLNYMWDSVSNVVCSIYVGVCRTPTVTNHIVIADADVRNGIDFEIALGGQITGRISDSVTSAGVSSLLLNLVNSTGYKEYSVRAVIDNMTGDYTMKGIPDGSYQLFLENDYNTFNNTNFHIPQIYGGPECNYCASLAYNSTGTLLNITSANTINNIDFSLNVGASISGNTLDSDTLNPLAGIATIVLFNDSNKTVGLQIVYGTDYNLDADGSYFLGGLLPGNYYIQGDGRDYYQRELYSNKPCYWGGCYRNSGDLVSLAPLENKLNIDFNFEKGGLISGEIIDEVSGLPIIGGIYNNTTLEFLNAAGDVIGGSYANDDGTYTAAKGMPAGAYTVRTGSMFQGDLTRPYVNEKYNDIPCAGIACDLTTTNVTVSTGITTTGIDFALAKGNSFTGTVTDLSTSAPIAGVHVLVYKETSPGVVKFANWATTGDGSAGSLPIGEFEVSGLPDGTYYARTGYGSDLPFFVSSFHNIGGAAPAGWIDILYDGIPCLADCDLTMGTPIILPAVVKNTSGKALGPVVNFGLTQGAIITGKVSDFILKAPIKNVTVNVYSNQGTFMGSSVTNEQGEYITRGLPNGTYYLTTTTDEVLLDVKYGDELCYQGNCNPLDARPITVGASTNSNNKDFNLKTAYMHVFSDNFE